MLNVAPSLHRLLDRLVPEAPIAGCADPWVAQRRAHAFCAGLNPGAGGTDGGGGGGGGDAARFYTAEAAKVRSLSSCLCK